VLVRIHRVAAPKNDNILVAYQRPAFPDVRDRQRPATRGKRQLHTGRLAVRFGVWLVKVGLAIEKKKAVTATTPEREEAPQNDRTIASKYDGQHRWKRLAPKWSQLAIWKAPVASPMINLRSG
jgi:hypothetical protein